MSDLSEFQRGQIVGARLVGGSVTTMTQVLGVSRGTVSKVMTAYKVHGTASSARHKCGRKTELTARDRRTLKRIEESEIKIMNGREKQRAVIEVLAKEACEVPEIHKRFLTVYGAATIDISNVERRMKRFREGESSVSDKQRNGRLATAVTYAMRQ